MFTDVRKLQTFVAIVEEGSFNAAAMRLNTAQPWVSNQLRALEQRLGLTLVERSKGRMAGITPEGHQPYAIARDLLAATAAADAQIRAIGKPQREKLMLGVDPITLYIPERNALLAGFMADHPDIDLHMASRTPNELFDGLRKGELDLILTSAPIPEQGHLEMLPLYELDLCLLVPKQVVDAYRPAAHGSLRDAEIMVLQESYHTGIFPWLKTALAGLGVRWHNCPELAFPALMRYAARMGVATLVPDFSATMPEIREDMEVRRIHDPPLKVCWGLMRRKGTRHGAAERLWQMAASQNQAGNIKSL